MGVSAHCMAGCHRQNSVLWGGAAAYHGQLENREMLISVLDPEA